jgi:hypothetical protein
MIKRILFLLVILVFLSSCGKDSERQYTEKDRTITITKKVVVDNGFHINNKIFNLNTYENFLMYLAYSGHFLIVEQKDFEKTVSDDKVIVSMRYDMDENINAAVKFAYRENKFNIHSTYFVLHTANYYGKKVDSGFVRNENVISYLKKIQNDYGQEIGFHNDLVTLQVVYEIPSRAYLKNELKYLRDNGINIVGTTYHGSNYCYVYKYYNAYFWYEYPNNGWNYESIRKGFKTFQIEKDSLKNYGFQYEGGLLKTDYFFTDVHFVKGKRWNMNMVNFDTIPPGKKVIILLHPALWD